MAKIAISLPDAVLQEIERQRRARGESRSEFFRRAAEAVLRREREREMDERYVNAYLHQPETDEELALAWFDLAALAGSPWEEAEP